MYRILYIEDEKILGQLVSEALGKEGYKVLQVTNGLDALPAFRDHKPHLCLLDIMLPGKDGYHVAQQVRSIDKKVPIIFLTAKVQVSDLVAGFNAGCNDYIRKPFSIDELSLRVKNWLTEKYGTHDAGEATVHHIDDYIFYPQRQLLETPTGNIQLTHKEAFVLQLLYTHRNSVISRDYLMQKIWGSDTVYNSRTLDVYINRLRKYFGTSNNRIITLKSIGYRFICEG